MDDLRDMLRELKNPWLAFAVVCMLALIFFLYSIPVSRAHDHEHPELNEWYATLMQPDVPTASCCGEADAYYCDTIHVKDGKTFCTITDDRVVPGRPQVDVGTVIEIPNHKLKWDRGNPTGHAVVFLSRQLYVFCFVQPGGV
jgi:hypothetical protein